MEEFYVFDKTNEEIKVNVYLEQLKVDSTNNDLHYVYEYLTEILGYPSIKLIMIVLCYDVSSIFFTIFLNFCFYGSISNTIDYISNNEISEE